MMRQSRCVTREREAGVREESVTRGWLAEETPSKAIAEFRESDRQDHRYGDASCHPVWMS